MLNKFNLRFLLSAPKREVSQLLLLVQSPNGEIPFSLKTLQFPWKTNPDNNPQFIHSMDAPDPNPSSSVRVLTRPPIPPSLFPTTPPIPPPRTPPDPLNPPSSLSPSSQTGVVVVGFIGKRQDDVTQLINRIIDSNVFGSGNFDRVFRVEKEGLGEEFCSTKCPVMEGFSESETGFDSLLEDYEFGDLQGMLFMFSVCHVIIFLYEGSHFDTQILKKFRVLQAAKNAMAPFARSQIAPTLSSRLHSSPSTRNSVPGTPSNNPSPGRRGGILARNGSAITLLSGLGSYTSLFPGHCTPVTLFVFLDDFSDVNPSSTSEESMETSPVNHASGSNSLARPSLPTKGSGSVVMLARPMSKSEGGFRKKLQSSLEAQIRFSIKKCRTLSGSDSSHAGSRTGGISGSSVPLFALDASKAVALVDIRSNQVGESLEFATGLVDDVLNGNATSDSLLLESPCQNANKEGILSVKEFIHRQSDILRGKVGLVANSNSGSAAGVGMVAVAAAAAAASAASGKTIPTPELPLLEIWLSSAQLILQGILSAKRGCIYEPEISRRKPRQRNVVSPPGEGIALKGTYPLEIAVSYLECGIGLNAKFSTSWCQRSLPVAKEVYLNELPACYPTSQHEAHLEKALCAFNLMVKGPAVPLFVKKLEDECTSIWSSGRQLCDAVSLTGKPCIYQRHEVESGGFPLTDEMRPHSSGLVFLHACACGRSRRLRSDPFDFETANVTSNSFPDCDKLLPALQLPQGSGTGPIQPSSWSLIRVGGARYYQPSKGLLQSGFWATQKFLLKWIIFLEKHKNLDGAPTSNLLQLSVNNLGSECKVESMEDDTNKADAAQFHLGEMQSGVEMQIKTHSENVNSDDKKISFGREIPKFTMRKPFSEVVAGSAASNSGFPPLQSRKQSSLGSEKGTKQNIARDRGVEHIQETTGNQGSQKIADVSAVHETGNGNGIGINGSTDSKPFVQIGSNIVPVNIKNGKKIKPNTSLKHVTVYVGYEHECPYGHRFILTPEHLNELGSPYAMSEESHVLSSVKNSDLKVGDPLKLVKNGSHGKIQQRSNGRINAAVDNVRNLDKSKEGVANGNIYLDGPMQVSRQGKEQNNMSIIPDTVKDLEASLQSVSLDDGGYDFALLNRNIPLYMNCPRCRDSMNKKEPSNVKFAGTVSQLQRIFLVGIRNLKPLLSFTVSFLNLI
ncbi:unnamed protein product [Ilex paraguariensis]|uniref:Nonsense-mediated mRNA decay factor SMG8 n=1 Tax=Ilex paraguariensis TaxID=185542 RepID=A0ABC8R4H2_9AQUA